uniref:Uncharacterized protein n=1 Tax=Romanomermis culicivorax TaxID=13658 RepID=A0A915JJ71_ROMCU
MFDSEAERRLECLLSSRDQSNCKNQREQINLWSILKNNVGKELWKIAMPVSFNEPLSFLQRLSEYMENYELLIKASAEHDPIKRLE